MLTRLWNKPLPCHQNLRSYCRNSAKDNVVSFEYQKVAPRIYKIKIPRLGVGEYGFLAPGALAGANVASQGKIYTLQIVE